MSMSKLTVRELSPAFGAEVLGLDPHIPLDAETCQTLRKLFDERKLLVFRDLDIDVAFQTYLSGVLIGQDGAAGEPGAPLREYMVSNKEPGAGAPFGRLLFHSDMMWRTDISQLLSLYGVEVEQPAAPTMFVSTGYAWKTLPDDLRARVEGRFAEHGQDATYQDRAGGDTDVLTATFKDDERLKLPIGHRHPRTGETLLYVCPQMTLGITDMPTKESEALLEDLFKHLYRPEFVVEHHWRKGDLVLWDNIALQHARPNVQAGGPTRTLRKTFAPAPTMTSAFRPQFGTVGQG
jgi:taurine dioxygenase